MRRFLIAVLACLGLTAGALVAASPAYATVFQTYGSGVNVRADAYLSSGIVGTLSGPTSIDVDCQKSGDLVSNSDGTCPSALKGDTSKLTRTQFEALAEQGSGLS